MLAGQKGQKLVVAMPGERVLTETGGPFVRGKSGQVMPRDIPEAEAVLGRLWNESPEAVRSTLLGNLRQLVSRHSRDGAP
jgi:TatD DNase family protein